MAAVPPTQKSGKPWSGTNKIPNIHEFVANLDKDKAKRDQEIDAHNQQTAAGDPDIKPHKNEERSTKGKTVTDPVTGKQVVIEDVNKRYLANVDNPTVSTHPPSCAFC
jgi:hypothetical protein